MDNPTDALRQAIQNIVVQTATAQSVALKLPNHKFVQPKDAIWVEFHDMAGKTYPKEIGAANKRDTAYQCQVGVFQLDVLAPEDSGDGPAARIADAFRKALNLLDVRVPPDGRLTTGSAGRKGGPSGARGWFRTIIDCGYEFEYRG